MRHETRVIFGIADKSHQLIRYYAQHTVSDGRHVNLQASDSCHTLKGHCFLWSEAILLPQLQNVDLHSIECVELIIRRIIKKKSQKLSCI